MTRHNGAERPPLAENQPDAPVPGVERSTFTFDKETADGANQMGLMLLPHALAAVIAHFDRTMPPHKFRDFGGQGNDDHLRVLIPMMASALALETAKHYLVGGNHFMQMAVEQQMASEASEQVERDLRKRKSQGLVDEAVGDSLSPHHTAPPTAEADHGPVAIGSDPAGADGLAPAGDTPSLIVP